MAKLIIEGLTPEQAKELSNWYISQGDQHAEEWFDISEVPLPCSHVQRKGGCMDIHENGDVTLWCHTP
jgi:hypothetical protein